jgi:signal transduction histidine kinase
MYQALKDSLFLFVPIAASLTLSMVLMYLYFKEHNTRKLVFSIGLFLAGLGFLAPFWQSLGITPLFPSGEWLFMPLAFGVATAAVSSLRKVEDFKWPFVLFIIETVCCFVAFLVQFSYTPFRLGLMIVLMGISVPTLIYIFYKSRDSTDLHFLIATLCFLFEGVVMDLGSSVDIPVMLTLFGVVFIGFMFNQPDNVNPSKLPSFILLEKKLDEANRNLQVMEDKLLKAERLAAIGELAGLIGHDLRNPLQGIRGATYYLKSHTNSPTNTVCKEMLNEIDDCIERSDKIINDLIEYSQVIRLEPLPANPRMLIDQALGRLESPTNVEILNKVPSEPVLVIDINRVERAFAGIIKNSFDAMPDGGTLTLSCKKASGKVVFSFQDTGLGMNEETLHKLWTPLFTTKAKGMGFGLAISKRVIEAHRGSIAARSVMGKGTTVTVVLPISPNVAVAQS